MEDLLTIAIPVFNRSCFVRESLESALNQTVSTRVIMMDNASTAFDFEALVKEYACPRLKYYRNAVNLGAGGTWNRAIEVCETPYLLILHDDDRLELSYAEHLREILPSEPDIVVCRSNVMDEHGRAFDTLPQEMKLYEKLEGWAVCNPWVAGAVFSVRKARALNGFKKQFKVTGDFDFWFRLALGGKFCLVDKVMAWYRVYQSPDRGTSVLESTYDMVPRLRVQIRRNRQALLRAYPDKIIPWPKSQYLLALRPLLKILPQLSPWRANYALAVFVQSPAKTLGGKALRLLFRIAGKPLCALIRAFSPAAKK